MIKRLLSFCVLAGISTLTQGQEVYNKLFGVYEAQDSTYHLMQANNDAGSFTDVGTALAGIDVHFTAASTVDRNNDIYYVCATDTGGTKKLYGIDLNTGNILTSPNLDFTVSEGRMELHYHNGKNKLYGVNLQSGNDNALVVEVNPTTGGVSTVKSISNVNSKINGSGALDEVGNRFFFNAADEFSDFKMYVVNLDDSTSVGKPYSTALLIPPYEMKYDPIDGVLYGLVRNDNGQYYFSKISSNTALVTQIDNINHMSGIFIGSAALDAIERRYFFLGFDDESKKRFYTVNVENGEVISSPEVTSNPLLYGVDLEYMFWGLSEVGENKVQPLQVYPNPADDVVWFNIPFQGTLQVDVHDMMGKTVSSQTFTNPGLNRVDVSNLPQGIYNIRAGSGDKFYAGSIVVK